MHRGITINKNLLIFGIPLALLGILIFLIKPSFLLSGGDIMSLAVTIDLLLAVPLIYFLLIRKTEIPKTTVIPVMLVGMLIGSFLMPKESQMYLTLFKTWALPIVEISVLTFVIIKVRKAVKTFKGLEATPDIFDALKSTCYEILPKKLVLPFTTEVAVMYYGFFNWKKPQLKENEFTYHRKSGTPALFAAFIFIIAIETIALHFLLAQWNIIAAWVLTILSLYTGLQVFGFARSLTKRPIAISPHSLTLRYGILNEAEIPFEDIESIELSGRALDNTADAKTLSPLGELESHNVIIHLKKDNTLFGLYGMKKHFKVIALHIDEPAEFREKMGRAIEASA